MEVSTKLKLIVLLILKRLNQQRHVTGIRRKCLSRIAANDAQLISCLAHLVRNSGLLNCHNRIQNKASSKTIVTRVEKRFGLLVEERRKPHSCREQLQYEPYLILARLQQQSARRVRMSRVRVDQSCLDEASTTSPQSSHSEKITPAHTYSTHQPEPKCDQHRLYYLEYHPYRNTATDYKHDYHQPPTAYTSPSPPPAHQQQRYPLHQQQLSLRFSHLEPHPGKDDHFAQELTSHCTQQEQPPDGQQDQGLLTQPGETDSGVQDGMNLVKSAGSSDVERSGPSSFSALPRYKRPAHKEAEYRRRDKIKRGIDLVQTLVPAIRDSPSNTKQSKASMLTKCAQHIRDLSGACSQQELEMTALKAEVDAMQKDLLQYQQQLPSSGMSAVETSQCQADQLLDKYIHSSISSNWKFWIFSFLVQPLYLSYTQHVSIVTTEDFQRTLLEWSDRYLTLVHIRPIILLLLRKVSTLTSVLTQPSKLQEEVQTMVFGSDCATRPAATAPCIEEHGQNTRH